MATRTTGEVLSPGLNLRAAPKASARSLDKLAKGDLFDVLEKHGKWLYVRVQKSGQRGYLHGQYVRIEAPKPDVPRIEPEAPIEPWVANGVRAFWIGGAAIVLGIAACVLQ